MKRASDTRTLKLLHDRLRRPCDRQDDVYDFWMVLKTPRSNRK